MYIRTREELGHDQATRSPLQTFNRPAVLPIRMGYLGNINEHLGNSPNQTCIIVDNFNANGWGLTKKIQLTLDKFSKSIVRMIERRLRKLHLKRREQASVHLGIDLRGHMDPKTDTQLKSCSLLKTRLDRGLDARRAAKVFQDLQSRVESEIKTQNLHDRFNFNYLMDVPDYSCEGTAHPVDPDVPEKNRRVEVCIRNLRVEKL